MATAAPQAPPAQVGKPNNRVHLFRLLTLTVDEGTLIVRNIFDDKRPKDPLDVFLVQERHIINQLRNKKTINQSQYNLMFPQIGTAATTDFDLSLTICLLKNLNTFGLNQNFSWNAVPPTRDTSLEADLRRIQIIRNKLAHISATTGISKPDFKSKWNEIENVLLRLNASLQNPDLNLPQRIGECKKKPLDADAIEGIEQRVEHLQTLIKTEVENLQKNVGDLSHKHNQLVTQFQEIRKEVQTLKTDKKEQTTAEGESQPVALRTRKRKKETEEYESKKTRLKEVEEKYQQKKKELIEVAEKNQQKRKGLKEVEEEYQQKRKEEPAERLNIFQRLWRRLRWKREYNRKKEGTESDWTTSIENKDEEKMYELLEKGQIPDAALLDKACQTFGLKSPILKDISTKIEENITASSDCIIYTYACYKETEKDEIVFVVITREATDYVDLSKVKYSVLVRSKDVCSPEGKIILDKEIGLRFEDSEMEALESVLKEKSPYLMENHSNLTLTTGSMFKSQYLDAEEFSVEKNICIVLYVTVKGLIPVGEDLFPTKLGQFNTDVREGRFYFAAGGPPKAKHEQLNIGCRISCKDGSGTIGGFVQHPEQGVCAITCAHVVLSDSETNKLLKKKKEYHGIGIGKECFQPDFNKNGDEKCGEVVEVKMIQGDSNDVGVDVALVQINDNRLPTDWRFPDCDSFHLVWGCSQCKGILHTHMPPFKTCTILDIDQITTQTNVVKYGQETQFTFGEVKVKGGSARFEIERKKGTLTLHNLFEICNKSNNLDYPFASEGDSGSLVFSNGENNELHAFGLLVGCRGSITLVQPICSVLEHLSFQRPFPFISFD